MAEKKTKPEKAPEEKPVDIQAEILALQAQFKQLVVEEERELTESERLDRQVERFAELYKDPFDDHDVLRIKKHLPPTNDAPEGWKLGWKSPRVREMRGMRGWTPCTWDDVCFKGPNGESRLGEYTNLGGDNLTEVDRTDSIIRVKDLMLCRIDARYAKARALRHIVENHRTKKISGEASPEGADTGISQSIGVGMEDDHAGRQLEKLAGVSLNEEIDSKFNSINKE